jgi:hypothetical protein
VQILKIYRLAVLVTACLLALMSNSWAQETTMNNERLGAIIQRIDENAKGRPGYWQARVGERTIIVITDEKADRMRVISPIAKADELDQKLMFRILQANFDTALDARYSIAKGVLWSLYLHPLSSLSDKQFLTGVGQVVNLAESFGSTFSSGGISFGGGDSNKLIQDLLDRGLSI